MGGTFSTHDVSNAYVVLVGQLGTIPLPSFRSIWEDNNKGIINKWRTGYEFIWFTIRTSGLHL